MWSIYAGVVEPYTKAQYAPVLTKGSRLLHPKLCRVRVRETQSLDDELFQVLESRRMAGAPQDVTDSVTEIGEGFSAMSLNTQNGDTSKVDGVDDVDAVKVVGGVVDNAEEVAAEHAAEQEATLQRLRSELEDEKVEVVEEEVVEESEEGQGNLEESQYDDSVAVQLERRVPSPRTSSGAEALMGFTVGVEFDRSSLLPPPVQPVPPLAQPVPPVQPVPQANPCTTVSVALQGYLSSVPEEAKIFLQFLFSAWGGRHPTTAVVDVEGVTAPVVVDMTPLNSGESSSGEAEGGSGEGNSGESSGGEGGDGEGGDDVEAGVEQ